MNAKKTGNGNHDGLHALVPGQPVTIVMTDVVIHAKFSGFDAAGNPVLNIRTESRFCERVNAAVGHEN